MVKNVFSAALKELPMMEEGISDSSNDGTSFDHRQRQQQQQHRRRRQLSASNTINEAQRALVQYDGDKSWNYRPG
jgi:hypothetical protein